MVGHQPHYNTYRRLKDIERFATNLVIENRKAIQADDQNPNDLQNDLWEVGLKTVCITDILFIT